MAKNSDHRAGGLETDNTGGVLSGLLAEEEDLDRRALWRLGSWGVGAVAAVVVAVMANQTQFGWKRDQMAAADLGQRAQQIQNVANQTEREARRLAAAIDTLNSDRDRLYTRVTGLERGLDSVTGSIARQNSAAASAGSAFACRAPSFPKSGRANSRPHRRAGGDADGCGNARQIRRQSSPSRTGSGGGFIRCQGSGQRTCQGNHQARAAEDRSKEDRPDKV